MSSGLLAAETLVSRHPRWRPPLNTCAAVPWSLMRRCGRWSANGAAVSAAVEGFILDGFPRTLAEPESLKGYMESEKLPLSALVNYELSLAKIATRLSGPPREQ
jgi:hypothetical protein